jgi:hypothetical protein
MLVVAWGGVAVASSNGPSSAASSFFDDVAKHLGISTQTLSDATKAAAIDQIDAALKAGKITQAQADALKARVQSTTAPFFGFGLRGLGGAPGSAGHVRGHGFGFGFGGPLRDSLPAAADYLGLTVQQLAEKLAAGQSLADVATAQGKSVSGLEQTLLADAKDRLDKAVKSGWLTADQESAILQRLQQGIDMLVHAKRPSSSSTPPGGGGFGFGFRFHGQSGHFSGAPTTAPQPRAAVPF